MHREELPDEILVQLRKGVVIPAHPLALTPQRQLDERHQRALTRYYLDAGAGGLAVGVHATQFEIRDVGLYEPVLRMAAETAADIYEYLQNKLMLMGQFNPMERMVPMATRFQEAQDQVVQVLEVGVEVQFSLKQIQ